MSEGSALLALFDAEQEALADLVRALQRTVGVVNPHELEHFDETKAWRTLAETGLLRLRRRENG